jgi:PAS domain S-box-containing protein
MGRAIADYPWAETPLGALEIWPSHLRMAVNLMLEAAVPIAVVWGKDSRFLYNDGYRDIIQDKHPSALGAPGMQIFPELWQGLLPLVNRALSGEAVVSEDLELAVTRRGQTKLGYFSFSYNPLRAENGAVDGFVAVVVETTAQVLRAQENARVFDTVLSAITDFAYTFDRDGRFLYVNKALLDLWGLKLEDAIGKNFFDLKYPQELASRLQQQIQQVITEKQTLRDETPYVSPTGKEGYYEYIFSPVFGPDGAVSVVGGSTREITNRKDLERDLRESEVRARQGKRLVEGQNEALQLIISGAPLAQVFNRLIAVVEAEGAGDAVASVFLLDASTRQLRHGAAPSLPEEYNRAVDGIVIDPDLGTCAAAAARNEVVITPDFETAPGWQALKHWPLALGLRSAWSMPIVSATGAVVGTFGTYFRSCRRPSAVELEMVAFLAKTAALAIERAASESELRAARDDALAASRAKDEFLATLSHELRTPLNPVLLLASEAAANLNLSEEVRADFEVISRSVALEARLIDDLLDLTRIAHDKLSLELKLHDVQSLLLQVIKSMQQELRDKGLTLTTRLEAPHATVIGDEVRLQQIFWNLIKNAVKFTQSGGEITVSTQIYPQRPDILTIEVKDTGIGLTAAELTTVFNSFAQGEHSELENKRRYGGLGLGLTISRKIAELHSGSISAHSLGRNRGATFLVELPLTMAGGALGLSGPAPKEPAAVESAESCRRVLLVEDHDPSRIALARLLANRKIDVVHAASAAEALARAEAEAFDLVISDIGLPDSNGYELMKQLRTRHGCRGIALSGYGTDEDIIRSHEAGFMTHLTKPVQAQALDHALKQFGGTQGTA